MSQKIEPQRLLIEKGLDAVGILERIPFDVCGFAVEQFDGTSGSVVLTRSPIDKDERAISLAPGKAQSFPPTGAPEWVLYNRTPQAGKTIKISVGGFGHSFSPGYSNTAGSASAENQTTQITAEQAMQALLASVDSELENKDSLASGQFTAGNPTALQMTGRAIEHGQSVCIKALVTNTGTIYIGVSGVTASTGFELSAGESVSLRITNLNLVYAVADAAGQVLCWIVEKAA